MEQLWVDTTPAKDVVVTSLTKDARPDECLYDLIDNAIDAAREDLLKKDDVIWDDYKLPANYDGYCVQLDLSSQAVTVSDNCGGMKLERFSEVAFRFGQRSNHTFGIGTFGVGLNRALFRLGARSKVKTDDGKSLATVEIDHRNYVDNPDWMIPAQTQASSGICGTSIEIFDPSPELAREFARPDWIEKFRADAARRYFRLLAKGFEIFINGATLRPDSVALREDGPYKTEDLDYTEMHGVRVYMKAGEHIRHRLTAEKDFDYTVARSLTPEYGWTVICNDRAIIVSDRSARTGWDGPWHPEYNGFVGYVWFVSERPEQLPWNTKKTDVDIGNEVYRVALEGMRTLATRWRTFNRKTRKMESTPSSAKIKNTGASPKGSKATNTTGGATTKIAATPSGSAAPTDHTQCRTILPADIDEQDCRDKILRLVREAKSLHIESHTYSGLLLLRTLFELSAVQYLALTNRLVEFKKERLSAINNERSAKGQSDLSLSQEHNYSPSFEDICSYFLEHPDAWGIENFNYLKHSLDTLKKNRQVLNGVAHNPYRLISINEAINIRDAAIPLLRHLLSTGSSPRE